MSAYPKNKIKWQQFNSN